MRLMFLASAVILATAAGAAAPQRHQQQQEVGDMPVVNPRSVDRAGCPPISRYEAARRGGRLGIEHLNELPDADVYKAVYRHVDGCEVPIIVRYGIAGTAAGRR